MKLDSVPTGPGNRVASKSASSTASLTPAATGLAGRAAPSLTPGTASVEFSSRLQALREEAPDPARARQLQAIKSAIAEGRYEIDDDAVAERMIEESATWLRVRR